MFSLFLSTVKTKGSYMQLMPLLATYITSRPMGPLFPSLSAWNAISFNRCAFHLVGWFSSYKVFRHPYLKVTKYWGCYWRRYRELCLVPTRCCSLIYCHGQQTCVFLQKLRLFWLKFVSSHALRARGIFLLFQHLQVFRFLPCLIHSLSWKLWCADAVMKASGAGWWSPRWIELVPFQHGSETSLEMPRLEHIAVAPGAPAPQPVRDRWRQLCETAQGTHVSQALIIYAVWSVLLSGVPCGAASACFFSMSGARGVEWSRVLWWWWHEVMGGCGWLKRFIMCSKHWRCLSAAPWTLWTSAQVQGDDQWCGNLSS